MKKKTSRYLTIWGAGLCEKRRRYTLYFYLFYSHVSKLQVFSITERCFLRFKEREQNWPGKFRWTTNLVPRPSEDIYRRFKLMTSTWTMLCYGNWLSRTIKPAGEVITALKGLQFHPTSKWRKAIAREKWKAEGPHSQFHQNEPEKVTFKAARMKWNIYQQTRKRGPLYWQLGLKWNVNIGVPLNIAAILSGILPSGTDHGTERKITMR